MASDASLDFLSDQELEHIVLSLRTSPLECVGSAEWSNQMSLVEKLNVQAALEAERGGEERVRDALVEAKKMPLLIHELLTHELWRTRILPKILAKGAPQSSFQIYMVLFHEANLTNLLETILFASSAAEALEDAAIDLTDYVVRQLSLLCSGEIVGCPDDNHTSMEESVDEELRRLQQKIQFQVAMKCLSILRYLSDHVESSVLSVSVRMLVTHDVPVLLAHLLQSRPWEKDGRVFEGSDWARLQDDDDGSPLAKLEAQAWLALYNLLSKDVCKDKYELHHYRMAQLIQLSGSINESKACQLPILSQLKEWLVRREVGEAAGAPTKDLVLIEAVAEIHAALMDAYGEEERCEAIAKQSMETFVGATPSYWQTEAASMLSTFECEAVQRLFSSSPQAAASTSCSQCFEANAKMRCSRCKKARYCSEECQVKHWPRHRPRCSSEQ